MIYALNQSPTDPSFVQDPYRFYEETREHGPLAFWPAYDMVCAFSYETVSAALRDKRMGRACPSEMAPTIPPHLRAFYAIEANSMLELDPPVHTRLRNNVLRAFTTRRIAELEPEIEALAHQLIDQFPDTPFDLLQTYAETIPLIIIARLIGVPETDAVRLRDWSHAMVGMYQADRTIEMEHAANHASSEFTDYLHEIISKKRASPGDDLLSVLIAAADDATRLSEAEMISTSILLLNAGHEATVHTIGNSVKILLETGHRDITERCIAELLRFDPPLHLFTRYVYEDLEFAGHSFKRGDQIGCMLAAANRDPAAFEQAHVFDPERPIKTSTSFGGGIHFCVGAPLARLEMQVALRVLFERCPDLRFEAPPVYAQTYHFHGLSRLMVRV